MPPPSADAAEPTTHRIVIENFAFVPERLEIQAGDTVVWINRDIAPHTASADGRTWDTGSLGRGRSAAIGFAVSGTFAYVCRHHPHMRGEITVAQD